MSRHGPWSDKVAALLTQFPGPVTLHPSKLKWVAFFVVVALPMVFGILLLWPELQRLSGKDMVIVAAFFIGPILGLFFVAVITFGRDLPRITLDAEGFEIRYPFSTRYMHWSEVGQFYSFLFLAFHVDTRPPHGRWDRYQRAYLGGDHRFWNDNFGLGAKNFVRLMNAWRERALAQ
jgi:hypothetical protein